MSFEIGAPQKLLLTAAFSPDMAASAAALARWWKDIADFDAVRGTDAALFAQIYWNLGAAIADQKLAARMKGVARHQWMRNSYLIETCAQLLDLLAGRGIPVLLLKGAAIASVIEKDPGLRIMADCDFLIPRERALEAAEVLSQSHLVERGRLSERDLDLIHGLDLVARRGGRKVLDLHWRPIRAIAADELAQEMFAAAGPARFVERPCLAPCREHMLFHAIVHGAEWSPHPRYDWLVDAIRILRRGETGFDWAKLVDVARRYRFGFILGSALDEGRRHVGLAVPGWAIRRLRARIAPIERREARLRVVKPAALSPAGELLLALQQLRRNSARDLERSALAALPKLFKILLGAPPGDRSFIDNDLGERVTLLLGWSAPQPEGRWTEGRYQSLAIRTAAHGGPPLRPRALKLRAYPLRAPGLPAQTVDVFAGLRRLGKFSWPEADLQPFAQMVRLPAWIWRGDTAVLRFHVHSRVTPLDIGPSGDPRALGIFVQEIETDPPLRDLTACPLEMASSGADLEGFWHGWCSPEPHGCWTFGRMSVLRWRTETALPAGAALLIELTASAPGSEDIRGRFRLDGEVSEGFKMPAGRRPEEPARLALPRAVAAGEEMELAIEIDNPRSPAEATGSSDMRPLGLAIRRVWIEVPAGARFSPSVGISPPA